MKRTSFIAAFVANAANAILTKPGITPDIVFKAANDYADEAERRGYIEPNSAPKDEMQDAIEILKNIVTLKGKIARKTLEALLIQHLQCTKRFAADVVEYAYINGIITKENPDWHYSPIILSEQ